MKTLSIEQAQSYISELTAEKCESIALDDGCMSIVVEATNPPSHMTIGRVIDGWTLFWIPVSKDPVQWQLVLGADSTRTHQLAIEGRVRRLVNDYGYKQLDAEQYVEASHGVQYGQTDEVIRLVRDRRENGKLWRTFPGPSPAIRYWLNGFPKYKNVNHGKLAAANKIIKILQGAPEVTEGGIETLENYNLHHRNKLFIPKMNNITLAAAWG